MVKNGKCNNLISILTTTFNLMLKFGYCPSDFNKSLVTPIPKKGNEQLQPSDFRPISVSNTFSIIFEKLILKINFNDMICDNQFGYKDKKLHVNKHTL